MLGPSLYKRTENKHECSPCDLLVQLELCPLDMLIRTPFPALPENLSQNGWGMFQWCDIKVRFNGWSKSGKEWPHLGHPHFPTFKKNAPRKKSLKQKGRHIFNISWKCYFMTFPGIFHKLHKVSYQGAQGEAILSQIYFSHWSKLWCHTIWAYLNHFDSNFQGGLGKGLWLTYQESTALAALEDHMANIYVCLPSFYISWVQALWAILVFPYF